MPCFSVLTIVLCTLVTVSFAELDREPDFLAQVNDAVKASLDEKLSQGFKSKSFRKAGNSLRKSSVTSFSNAYTTSGFVYQNLYIGTTSNGDASCSSPTIVYGEAVNRCHVHENFSYKYQIATDNCKGAIVEYFGDQECKFLLGTSDFEQYSKQCGLADVGSLFDIYDAPVYQSVRCTTSNLPVVPSAPFTDNSCGGLENTFSSVITDTCAYSSSIGFYTESDCASSFSLEFSFEATTCSQERQVFSAICFRNIDYDPTSFVDDDPYPESYNSAQEPPLDSYQNPAYTRSGDEDQADDDLDIDLVQDKDDKVVQTDEDPYVWPSADEETANWNDTDFAQSDAERAAAVHFLFGYCPAPAAALRSTPIAPPYVLSQGMELGLKESDGDAEEDEAERRLSENIVSSSSSWLITQARSPMPKPLTATQTVTRKRYAVSSASTEWLSGWVSSGVGGAGGDGSVAGGGREGVGVGVGPKRMLLDETMGGDTFLVGTVDLLTVACLVGMLAGVGFCATLWAIYSNAQETAVKGAILRV